MAAAQAQNFSQRGFLYTLTNLRFAAAVDVRTDTHRQTERTFGVSWWDRGRQRPLMAVRSLSATYTRGRLTVQAGKQLIRWGKAVVSRPPTASLPAIFSTSWTATIYPSPPPA